jgi:hypothetical protein
MSTTLTHKVTKAILAKRKLRKQKFQKMLDALPRSQHPNLIGRTIVDTTDAFEIKNMSINQFRHLYDHLTPVKVQRDHLRRIENHEVGYLHNLHMTHVNYVVVVHPADSTFGLCDGNTRTALMFIDDSVQDLPSHVAVMVYYPDTVAQYTDIYHCTDSLVNGKKTRHDVTSFYRDADKDPAHFTSPLVRDGALISALRRLARIRGYGAITGVKAEHKEVLAKLIKEVMPELEWLDAFGFRAKQLKSQGFYAAALALKANVGSADDKTLVDFVNEIHRVVVGNTSATTEPVKNLFKQLSYLYPQGFSGETPVDVVYGLTTLAFKEYLTFLSATASRAERTRLMALSNALPAVPEYFVAKLEGAQTKAMNR